MTSPTQYNTTLLILLSLPGWSVSRATVKLSSTFRGSSGGGAVSTVAAGEGVDNEGVRLSDPRPAKRSVG